MVESMVRPEKEEFGKEIGVVHEAIVHMRKFRAGKRFWATLAHDEDVAEYVAQFVAGIRNIHENDGNNPGRELCRGVIRAPEWTDTETLVKKLVQNNVHGPRWAREIQLMCNLHRVESPALLRFRVYEATRRISLYEVRDFALPEEGFGPAYLCDLICLLASSTLSDYLSRLLHGINIIGSAGTFARATNLRLVIVPLYHPNLRELHHAEGVVSTGTPTFEFSEGDHILAIQRRPVQ